MFGRKKNEKKDTEVQPDQNVHRGLMLVPLTRIAVGIALLIVVIIVTLLFRRTSGVGAGLLVASAALSAGVLLGFLFGIPRSRQGDPPAGHDDHLGVNTNLEQISDWLTKILVGVGLVEFGKIGPVLGRLVDGVSTAFGTDAGAKVIAGSLLVFASVTGFVLGYVFTRTWLFELFGLYAQDTLHQAKQAAAKVATEVAKEAVQRAGTSTRDVLAVVADQLDCALPETDAGELRRVLDAEAGATQRDEAFRLAQAVRRAPRPDPQRIRRTVPVFTALTEVAPDQYRYWAELGMALADLGAYHRAVDALTEAIRIRGDRPHRDWYELERAQSLVRLADEPDEATERRIRADLLEAMRNERIRQFLDEAREQSTHPAHADAVRLAPYLPGGR